LIGPRDDTCLRPRDFFGSLRGPGPNSNFSRLEASSCRRFPRSDFSTVAVGGPLGLYSRFLKNVSEIPNVPHPPTSSAFSSRGAYEKALWRWYSTLNDLTRLMHLPVSLGFAVPRPLGPLSATGHHRFPLPSSGAPIRWHSTRSCKTALPTTTLP
jgi:hypothetical protein